MAPLSFFPVILALILLRLVLLYRLSVDRILGTVPVPRLPPIAPTLCCQRTFTLSVSPSPLPTVLIAPKSTSIDYSSFGQDRPYLENSQSLHRTLPVTSRTLADDAPLRALHSRSI
ncbi:hypothetical protein C8R48DRAFT_675681 [Suillus tomentosus]|nr:hypothetical protein C8R48DRAFT_675681 [Suillus tomentosus]